MNHSVTGIKERPLGRGLLGLTAVALLLCSAPTVLAAENGAIGADSKDALVTLLDGRQLKVSWDLSTVPKPRLDAVDSKLIQSDVRPKARKLWKKDEPTEDFRVLA